MHFYKAKLTCTTSLDSLNKLEDIRFCLYTRIYWIPEWFHRFENTPKISMDMDTTILNLEVFQKLLCIFEATTPHCSFAANWSPSSLIALSLRFSICCSQTNKMKHVIWLGRTLSLLCEGHRYLISCLCKECYIIDNFGSRTINKSQYQWKVINKDPGMKNQTSFVIMFHNSIQILIENNQSNWFQKCKKQHH